jgi:hypothetical protein
MLARLHRGGSGSGGDDYDDGKTTSGATRADLEPGAGRGGDTQSAA